MGVKEGYVKPLLGFGRPDGVVELPGSHAAVRIPNARPTFYLRGLPAGSRLYLVHGTEREEYREVRMPMTRRFPNTPRFQAKDLTEAELEPVANDVMAGKPRPDLQPGRYVI